tara:strand:- start:735 stop:1406 length:672 start_codon:yes stop_codon:yes gene_type:complete
MDGILPAAGLASRMRGIPKFLLPTNKDYISLLEVHISNLSNICEKIYLPTRPELAPIIKSLDFNFRNTEIPEMVTSTMCETVNNTLSISESDNFILIMPDTFFLGEQPYEILDSTTDFCNLACWKIRDEQRGKLGEVMFDKNNVVLEMVDKKPDNGFEYAWGALTFNRKLKQYINNQDPHIGYAVKESVNKGEKVSVSPIEGNYFDCGTPEEYIKLLKKTLLT